MSTQAELAVSYDVSNDFFRLWLDQGMNYSCGLFLEPGDTLEQAQRNKLEFFRSKCGVSEHSRVLDIGCGWGGNLRYLSSCGVRDLSGITLSLAQYDELVERVVPNAAIECISYTDYAPRAPFDAVISIGMFEHLATPAQARSGAYAAIYRGYFRKAWEWSRPGARFGLQSVVGARIPRHVGALRELGWATHSIFPGAISPRLEWIVACANPWWEVLEVQMRREHYARTSAVWLVRLREHEATIRSKWGDQAFADYERYLGACVHCFENGYQSLAQLVLRRVDTALGAAP